MSWNTPTSFSGGGAASGSSATLRNAAGALQAVVDRFREQGGLTESAPASFDYQGAVRQLRNWSPDLERTISGLADEMRIASLGPHQGAAQGFAEICRQARRSIEVDQQRVVSRWVRDFITSHSGGGGATTSGGQPQQQQHQQQQQDPVAVFRAFSQVLEDSFPHELLTVVAPQVLDAALQWLLPTLAKRCRRLRDVVGGMKTVQRRIAEHVSALNADSARVKRGADDAARTSAQCRVALSDFHSHASQMLQELHERCQPLNDEHATHVLDRLTMSLNKFAVSMRESLSSSSAGDGASAGGSGGLPPALLLGASTSPTRVEDELEQLVAAALSSREHDFAGGGGDDVVVEVRATHDDKQRELEERKLFAVSHQHQQRGGGGGGGGVGVGQQHHLNNSNVHHRFQREAGEEDGNGSAAAAGMDNGTMTSPMPQHNNASNVISPRTHHDAIARLQAQLNDAQEQLENSRRNSEDRETVIDCMQQNLSAMSVALERVAAERAGDVLGAQVGAITMTGGAPGGYGVDFLSSINNNNNTNASSSAAAHMAHAGAAADTFVIGRTRGGFQSEVDLLRSQIAVQAERIAHLNSTVEEKTLREESLKREIDTLQAGGGILKSEMQYQQAALKAANDDLTAAHTALFETREALSKCEASRKQFADQYRRLVRVAQSDRQFATHLAAHARQMSEQLDQSVSLAQVDDLLNSM